MDTNRIYNNIWNNALRISSENWINRTSTTKGKRTSMRQPKEAEIDSLRKKQSLSYSNSQWGRIRKVCIFSLRSEGFQVHVKHSTPRSCTREKSPMVNTFKKILCRKWKHCLKRAHKQTSWFNNLCKKQ